MSRTSMRLTRSMLPSPARDLVPDEVSDTQLAFWWAAFELGRSAAGAGAPNAPGSMDLAAGSGTAARIDLAVVQDDQANQDDQVEPEWVESVIAYGVGRAPGADPMVIDQLLRQDAKVSPWIETGDLPSERVWTMVVDGVLERAKLAKDPTAGMGE